MGKLQERQKAILDRTMEAIIGFIKEKGYAPTVRDLMEKMEYRSTSVVDRNLLRLEAEGRIHREPGVQRSIVVLPQPKRRKRT